MLVDKEVKIFSCCDTILAQYEENDTSDSVETLKKMRELNTF